MSFSHSVKKELCSVITDKDRKYCCLYGMLLFCRNFSPDRIVFQTENEQVCEFFGKLTDDVLGGKNIAEVSKNEKKSGGALYSLSIPSEHFREEIIYRYRISSRTLIHRIQEDIIGNNSVYAFIAGAFLSCGSVTEPIKEYHLEFAVPYRELAEDLAKLLVSVGINAKYTERKNMYVIYLKGSEAIEDLLTLMGATMSSIDLMNVKIYKDVRNKANRIANCDSANIERTLKASGKQIEDIEYIAETVGLENLPEDLINIAELRREYPEMSLRELGEALDKPLGRSGANHRLKRISEIAEKLREEKGG
ncbi:MAG: DNA-binding protein WhiA [Ruminococcus sp.]|nr:DNA-binding protein WhiA [Ruminococcus sp.]MCM1382896.1 DNA-binding protein WhiA [Muribaculaceae bacterium]MCM1478679.1 DNA-binding protein WhiA [Muribaculaceae bacterium]